MELKPVDEDAGEDLRVVRLHEDMVEEVEEFPVVKVGPEPVLNKEGMPVRREDMKTRSQEPDLGSLIESDFHDMEDGWDLSTIGAKVVPWGWSALLALVFAAGIIWSLVQVKQSVGKRVEVGNVAKAHMEAEEQNVMDAEATLATIEKVTKDFFDSRSVDELLRYVRHSERVKPLLEVHYANAPLKPRRVTEFIALDPVTLDNRANFWFVSCMFNDGSETQVLVEVHSESEAKVDWETYVTYQPIPWDEFATKREGGYTGDFRVFVEQDHFYSHEFADSKNLECYRLSSLDSTEVLFGYVERKDELWSRLNAQLEKSSGRASPMILRLHVPVGLNSPRGVVITKIIAPRWLLIENPDER